MGRQLARLTVEGRMLLISEGTAPRGLCSRMLDRAGNPALDPAPPKVRATARDIVALVGADPGLSRTPGTSR